jgi:hypothetical protein
MTAGLALAVLTMFIRSVFRAVELSGGFNSTLFNEQIPFMILEGPMVIIAYTTLTALHPGIGFHGSWHEADFKFWTRKNTALEKNDPVLTDEQP